ncbi:hypothetical protein O5541_04340 [Escherichia coli]|nr:hypothetical protein [Escherichia coli]
MLQAMVIRGFQIHERQRQMKEDVAGLTVPTPLAVMLWDGR